MSGYGQAIGYASTSKVSAIRPARKIRKEKINWLNNDEVELERDIPQIEPANLQSEGMRFQLYKASGGYVIETTQYDHRNDRRHNKMYVITEDKDLGSELGKIITMEALRA
jgi:hypothetical protein